MSDRKIIEAVQKITGQQLADNVSIIVCTVESVNIPSRTCDCYSVGGTAVTDIPNVQLMADIDDGMLLVPSVGSTVLVAQSTRGLTYVCMYSQLDKVLMISGSSSFEITDQLMQFNDGTYGGLVIIAKLVEKLNNLEKAYNDLAAKFNTHTHILTLTSGTGTAAPTAVPEETELIETQRGDIENTNTKHGV